jgi:hypothetical protein
MDLPVSLRVENHLRDACSIPQIDEHHHPVVTAALYPAVQDDSLTDVNFSQVSASMGSNFHVTLSFLTGR